MVKEKGRFSIPFSLAVALAFGIVLSGALPGVSIFLSVPLALIFLFFGTQVGLIRKPGIIDLALAPIVIVLLSIVLAAFTLKEFAALSFGLILAAGIISDIISVIEGGFELIPVFGFIISLITSVLVFFLVSTVIGGLPGIILGSIASTIILIPGPIPLVTISFVLIKLIAEVFF